MSSATSILSLSPELVIPLLAELSIQDIVNVAQTCSYLRAVIRCNKQSILQNPNASAILDSLPLGFTPSTISPEILYATTASSIATSRRLSSGVPLTAKNHTVYDLSKFDIAWDRHGHLQPSDFFLVSNLLVFRSSSNLFFLKLGPSGVVEESIILKLSSGYYAIAYQVSDDRRSLFIAVLTLDHAASSEVLRVYEVPIWNDKLGDTTCHLSVGVPYSAYFRSPLVTIRDPYVAVTIEHDDIPAVVIINMMENRGVIIDVCDTEYPVLSVLNGQDEYQTMGVANFKFHAQEPVLFIMDEVWPSQVFWVDIPDDMPVLPHSLSFAQNPANLRKVFCREEPFLLPFDYAGSSRLSPHQKSSPSSHAFDVIGFNPGNAEFSVTGEEPIEQDCMKNDHHWCFIMFRVSYDLHLKWQVECLHFPEHSPSSALNHVFLGYHILNPGVYFTTSSLDSAKTVITSKFEDGQGHGTSVVRLTIPGHLDLPARPNERIEQDEHALYQGDPAPSLFDVRTGRLYFFDDIDPDDPMCQCARQTPPKTKADLTESHPRVKRTLSVTTIFL
ncbi:hypothetical protein SISNIDRAFT_486315 [Sistotremastrum niveocremeum HHB9708]|uniref:F-box domain-containing protein n=1 Tax=Sistotremastrum niveocremeum HHB9708 TaxID=1314777 RepID=A0A164U0S9_9AGAM|nr:hypothetical protein SISNIDRAFT_486315 [Sistotremastrum niveocremeum HHB9708]